MKFLSALLTLIFLAGCTPLATSGFAFNTLKDKPLGTTLTYRGTFTPPLDQRFREKSLIAQEQGQNSEAQKLKNLIGQKQAVAVTVTRKIDKKSPNRITISNSVVASEGSTSKKLTKDASHFKLLITPFHDSSPYTINFGTIPLTPGTTIKSENLTWEVIRTQSPRTVAGKRITPTLVRLTDRTDSYSGTITTFLLSDDLPGRLIELKQKHLNHGKPNGGMTLKLSNIR